MDRTMKNQKWIEILLILGIIALLLIFVQIAQAQDVSFEPVEGKTETSIGLAWEQVMADDLAGWRLYAKTPADEEYIQVKEVPYDGVEQPEYATNVPVWTTPGTEQTVIFTATAFDNAGNESEKCDPATGEIDKLAPSVPGALRITVTVNVTVNP